MVQEADRPKCFQNASNPLQILYKTVYSGTSGPSRFRRPDLPDPFQMLQILYKSLTKRSTLEPRAPRGSGGRICQILSQLQILYKTVHSGASGASWLRKPDLPDPLQMLQILYKSFTKRSILEHLAPHGSGGRICQTLPKCFKSFTNPLQNGVFWSLWPLEAQEVGSARPFPNALNPL